MPVPTPPETPVPPSVDPLQRLMPRMFYVVSWTIRAIAVLTVVLIGLMARDLVHRWQHLHHGFQSDLTALHLSGHLPAVTDVTVTSRDHRPTITTVTFATGQSVVLNADHRWIYLQFPWSQWDRAVALQREGNRRVRAGDGSSLTVNDDGSVNTITGVPTTGANAVRAWNAPRADCPWCDTATLADGTTVQVAARDRLVLVALPLSMLPEVLALPGHPSQAY